LRDRDLVPGAAPSCDYYVIWVGPDQRGAGLEVSHRLRAAGHSVMYSLRPQGVGKQLRAADRAGARRALIIGPDEAASGSATVRDLRTGSQKTRSLPSLLETAATHFAGGGNP